MSRYSWKRTGTPPTMARRPATAQARFVGETAEAGRRGEDADVGALRAELALPCRARSEAEGGHRAPPARHEPKRTLDAERREPEVVGVRREHAEAELVAPGLRQQRGPRRDVSDSASSGLAARGAQCEQGDLAGLEAVDDDAAEHSGEALEDVRERRRAVADGAPLDTLEIAVAVEEQRAHQPALTGGECRAA